MNPTSREGDLIDPSQLHAVPGTKVSNRRGARPDKPPLVDANDVRAIIDQAMGSGAIMEMVYLAKNGQRLKLQVQPQRLAFKGQAPVLVGLDVTEDARRTFVLDRIERLRIKEGGDD